MVALTRLLDGHVTRGLLLGAGLVRNEILRLCTLLLRNSLGHVPSLGLTSRAFTTTMQRRQHRLFLIRPLHRVLSHIEHVVVAIILFCGAWHEAG